MIHEPPINALHPCWYLTEAEIEMAKSTGRPFAENISTEDYFVLTERIDSTYIQGHLVRRDKAYTFLNDVRDNYSFLINYRERKKVYFTFDGIALYELQDLYPSHPNPILFTLKRVDLFKINKYNQAFMIMPFHQAGLDDFYLTGVKSFLKQELGIELFRADDFRHNDIIIETIYKLISESEFIIADTTIPNKNAFYELGYASALGKEIIMIQDKKEQKLFFDRAHIRSIFYDPAEIESFQFELKATIAGIRAKN